MRILKKLTRRLTAPAALAAALLLAAWTSLAVPAFAASQQPNITPSTVQIVPPGSTYPDVSGTLLDQYGNPIGGASLTLTMENATSGATPATLGPFTGTTNSNGQFSIQVTPGSVGQFWPKIVATNQYGSATFSYPSDLLDVTEYPPSTLYEWAVYGSDGPQNSSNVTPSTFTGQLYPIAAQLVNDTGTPINGANVTVSVPTDPGATVMALPPSCLETSSGCSSTESGAGSIQQTTGTYAASSGEVGVDVIFTQPGQQTVEIQYDNTVQTLTVTVYPGAVASITGWAVDTGNYADAGGSPVGSSVQAGTNLYVSGTAVNSNGQQVPAGTQVVVEMPGSNAAPVTTYTVQTSSGSGYFQAQLTPTAAGSWWVEAVASGSTFQDVDLGVTPGTTYSARPWGITFQTGWTCTTSSSGAQSCTATPAVLPQDASGPTFSLVDQYGNNEIGQPVNASFTCTASNGGVCPWSSQAVSSPAGSAGQVTASVGSNLPNGTYTVAIIDNSPSKLLGSLTFSVSNTAVVPSYVTNIYVTAGSQTLGPYSTTSSTPAETNSTVLSVPAGTPVTITGTLIGTNGQPLDGYAVACGSGGTGGGGTCSTTNAQGDFSATMTPYEVGSGSDYYMVWAVLYGGFPGWNQPLNVTPAPVSAGGQIRVTPIAPNVAVQWYLTQGVQIGLRIDALDEYGNPLSGTAQITTPMPNLSGQPQSFYCTLSNGTCTVSGIQTNSPGNWPINITVTDQYGDTKSTTAYENIE